MDLEGDYLMTGLLDLHTDNLENHYQPRPNVYWDPIAAAVNHDGEISVSGVTTVFDALCLGLTGKGELRAEHLGPLVEGIAGARAPGMLRADPRIHPRFDVIGPDVLDQLDGLPADPPVRLVSLMAHAPRSPRTPHTHRP